MLITETNIDLNEELQAFHDLARDFAKKELSEHVEENDFPYSPKFAISVSKARDVGFFGVNLPEEFGGIGAGVSALPVILENISIVDAGMACAIFTNAAALEIISIASGDDQSIYQVIADRNLPIAFQSFTSPYEAETLIEWKEGKARYCTGAEVKEDGSGYLLNGKLDFLVLGGMADLAVVVGSRPGEKAFSYYLIDLTHEGVEMSGPILSLGMQGCQAVDVKLKNVPGRLIGVEGEGERYFLRMMPRLSVSSASISLGVMKGSFGVALEYTKDRYQGGRQIIDWAEIRMILANFAIEIKVGETCLSSARRELDSAIFGWQKTAVAAAIHIGEMACRATVDGIQLLGGNGYMKDYGQERKMRDAKQAQSMLGMAPIRKMRYIQKVIEDSE